MIADLPDMLLTCPGVANYTAATFGSIQGSAGSASAVMGSSANSGATAELEVAQGVAKLRPPKVIVPGLSVGGKNGWWNVQGLTSSETEISGHIKFGFIATGRFRVDRRTGIMTISALGESFEGTCAKANATQLF